MTLQDLKQDFSLSISSNLSLHSQISDYFRMKIKSGGLTAGEQLVAETEICAEFGISRTTVRQAMDSLVAEGLIVRRRGKGSFVADIKLKRPYNYLYNFTENMIEIGVTPSSKVLMCRIEDADTEVYDKLKMPSTQSLVFHLKRIRLADDKPILIEETFIPYYLCEGIEKIDFSSESLYKTLLDKYGLQVFHAVETIDAVLIRKEEAEKLECEETCPGFKISRISQLDSGFTFEYTKSITNAALCSFKMDLYKNENNKKDTVFFERKMNELETQVRGKYELCNP